MNKEKTLAAHRLKKTIVNATNESKKANAKKVVAESKVKKMSEAFEVAKDVVEKHKDTLKLAKEQILENRELIKRYETLLDMKYGQVETLTKEVENLQEAKKVLESNSSNSKEVDETLNRCKQIISSKQREVKSLKNRCENLERKIRRTSEKKTNIAKSLTERYKNIAGFKTRQAESYKNKCKMLEAKIEELKTQLKAERVKAKVVPADDQAVKRHDAMKAKVENLRRARKLAESRKIRCNTKVSATEASKVNRIAKLFSSRFGISEAFSKKVLEKHGLREGSTKLQKLIQNSTKKPITEGKRITRKPLGRRVGKLSEGKLSEAKAKEVAKLFSEKFNIPEKASMNILTKYNQNEALVKLKSLARDLSKYQNEKKEKVTESKATDTKQNVNESVTTGTSLYSHFM